jgi:GNAT superfamily N-acetyltransferase
VAEVLPYRPEWKDAFEQLNREWIESYFVLEEADREAFRDPMSKILGPGGQIFFVVEDGVPVGTCAVLCHEPTVHEIAKMAVAPAAQGRGYGDLLMNAAVAFSRSAGAAKVIIVSNTRLGPAIRLYQKHGFVRVPLETDGRYVRADIKLERVL